MQSEQIGDLALAMSKAQAEMSGAKKDSKGNYGTFADLASVWDAARSALAAHDLAVIQTSVPMPDGVSIITTLMHKSGQWINGELYLPAAKKDPQGFGSAMTYCRRYALSAILGIAPEEDDAQGVTDKMSAGKIETAPPKKTSKPELPPCPDEKLDKWIEKVKSGEGDADGLLPFAKGRHTLSAAQEARVIEFVAAMKKPDAEVTGHTEEVTS